MRRKERLQSILTLVRQLRPYRWKMVASVLCGMVKELSVITGMGICAYVAVMVFRETISAPVFWLSCVVACAVARGLCAYLESYLSHDVAYHALIDYRLRLYDRFIDLCPEILLRQRAGQVATTLMNDIEQLEWFYGHTFGQIFGVSLLCLGMLVIAAGMDGSLAVVVALSFIVIAVVPWLMKDKAKKQGLESRLRLGEANSVTLEGINGMNEILTLNDRDAYLKKNQHFMECLTHIQTQYARRMGLEGALLHIVSGVAALAVDLISIRLLRAGSISLECFAVVGVTAWVAFRPLVSLSMLSRNFGTVIGASVRVAGVMNDVPALQDEGQKTSLPGEDRTVCFDHVSFRYKKEGEEVLKDVSFSVEDGTTVALVGASGTGKTTCINLLGRLWDPEGGRITIGGTDIRVLRLQTLHETASVVLQDVYLFHASIADNIRLGKPAATMEEVVAAAKMAKVHDFIASLPEGYETNAGERGVKMSGGQRQRIAIARALLQDRPILVLDEAVSNLDAKTDAQIQDTIRSLGHQKTILMVAHRLSTILEADKIVLLQQGRVVQVGTHQELLRECQEYRELIEAQLS